MNLNILKYPHNFLRGKSKNVKYILSEDNQELIANMKETLINADGAGLAGRQVGREENIFLVDLGHKIETFINPAILAKSLSKIEFEEGCLSIPSVYGMVKRSQSILIKYYNDLGLLKIKKFKGVPAIIIQHENDHNKGVLFIDKTIKITEGKELLEKYEKNNK